MKRPILYWVILFILGEVAGRCIQIRQIGLFVVGVIGIVCVTLTTFYWKKEIQLIKKGISRNFRRKAYIYLSGLLFMGLGVALWQNTQQKIKDLNYEEGEMISFSGQIYEVEEKETTTYYYLKVKQINDSKLVAKIRIELNESQNISTEKISKYVTNGNILYAAGEKKNFLKATNPGGFDEESYQYGKGVFLALDQVVIFKVEKSKFSLRAGLYQIRKRFEFTYDTIFGEREASLSKAMVLGNKSDLEGDIKELYQRNGIAHLIAISGLHIAMIGGTLYHLLRKRIGSYLVAAILGGTFIILYGGMTGFSGSTVRAVIMLLTMIGADVCGRKYDTLSAIALALFLMLVNNSFLITQVSFLLSFGAILGIALLFPIWKTYILLPNAFDGFGVSLCVQLMLLPVMLYFFFEIPVYGIVLNIIVVPLMSVLLAVLILCAIMGNLSLLLATYVAIPAKVIFMIYEELCKLCEKIPFHMLCTGRPSNYWILIYYVVIGLILLLHKWKRKREVVVGFLVLFILIATFYLPGELKLCMFDVGQGDGIYIQTPDKTRILIDGGSSTKKNIGKYVLKSGLKYYGGDTMDYVIISHSDSDHYSGIKELLEEDYIRIKNVVLPDITNPDGAYNELVTLAKKKKCNVFYMKKGDGFRAGEVSFKCFNPKRISYADKNQGSLVFLMKYNEFDMLFTADMDESVEQEILDEIECQLEVLKVAHHGSKTASSKAFLQQLSPTVSLVSVGQRNRYGHPAKEVISRLKTFSKNIYLTKDCGAITIETDGTEFNVKPFLTE